MSEFRVESHPVVFLRPRLSYPYAWVGHIPFAYLLIDLLRPRMLVELGTDSGNSYLAFCQAVVALDADTRCTAIDSWEGDPHARRYGEGVFDTLKRYHDPRYAKFSRLHRSFFIDALSEFEDGSIDLLHIDGLHTYEAVSEDFNTWLPKLSDRSVVIFHDSQVRGRDFGVARFLDEIRDRYRIVEFEHSNGLGIAQIGKNAPAAFVAFMDSFESRPTEIRQFFQRMGDSLVTDGLHPAGARSEQVTPDVTCRVYYRDESQDYDDSRVIMAELTDAEGENALEFAFPEGVRPAFVRIDPADHAGVFRLSSLVFSVGDSEARIDNPAARVGYVSGDLTETSSLHSVRLVSFGEDPHVDFAVGDLVSSLPPNGVLSLAVTVDFEIVLNTPSLWHLARTQNAALQELKQKLNDERPVSIAADGASLADISTVVGAMHVAGVVALPGRGPSLYVRRIGETFHSTSRIRGQLIGLDDTAVVGFELVDVEDSAFIRLDVPALAGTYRFSGLAISGVPVDDLRRRVIVVRGQLLDGMQPDTITVASPEGPPQVELDVSDLSLHGSLEIVVVRDLRAPWADVSTRESLERLERRLDQVGRVGEMDRVARRDEAEAVELHLRRSADRVDAVGEQLQAFSGQLLAIQASLTDISQRRTLLERILGRLRRMLRRMYT